MVYTATTIATLVLAGMSAAPDGAASSSCPASPAVSFGPPTTVMAVGDFDGDGDEDIVSSDANEDRLALLLNAGHGTFADAIPFAEGVIAADIAVADLDGDLDLDLAVASWNVYELRLLFNDGHGAFAPPVCIESDATARDVDAGDFDGDGDLDLAVAMASNSSSSLFLNNGTGTFAPAIPIDVGSQTNTLTTADLDGDGDLDIAAWSYSGESVTIVLNDGDAGLAVTGTFDTGSSTHINVDRGEPADLDGDGDIDLVYSNRSRVRVLRNDGSGQFGEHVDISAGAEELTSVDVDGDSDIDLIVNRERIGGLSILLSDGEGGFEPAGAFGGFHGRHGDVNGDGSIDLLMTTPSGITPSINDGHGVFSSPVVFPFDGGVLGAATGDLDGDLIDDLILLTQLDGDDEGETAAGVVTVATNDGVGEFTTQSVHLVGSGPPRWATIADVTGDDQDDVVVASPYHLSVLVNEGDGTFAPRIQSDGSGLNVMSGAVADFDGDGHADVLRTNKLSDGLHLALGNGDGTFDEPTMLLFIRAYSVVAADFDDDSDIDIAVPDRYFRVHVLLNEGDGTFAPPVVLIAGSNPRYIVGGDVDANGSLDLAVANYDSGDVSVMLGAGDGSFADAITYPIAGNATPESMTTADVDGDQDLDLVLSIADSDHTAAVLLNDGTGAFTDEVLHHLTASGRPPSSLSVTDLDGDLDMDLAFTSSGGITVILSDCASSLCPGDLDNSGDIGFGDILEMILAWGPCVDCPEDLDEDGSVGFGDLLAAILNWGPCN